MDCSGTECATTFRDVSYALFCDQAAEYFRATHDRAKCLPQQAQNGNKALRLLYLARTKWTFLENSNAVIALQLAGRRKLEVEAAHNVRSSRVTASSAIPPRP